MSRFRRILPFALIAIAAASCDGSNDVVQSPSTIPPGAMAYDGYDDSGQHVVTGWIRLDIASSAGEWQLSALVDPSTIGPQVGSGTLTLTFSEGLVGAQLNPFYVDNNVSLGGQLTTGWMQPMRYEGRWSFESIAGTQNSGPFTAVEP